MLKRDRDNIKFFLQDERFNSIIALSKELMDKWGGESCKDDSEFQTIWNLAKKEGKIEGLQAFFSNLDEEASS